MNVETALLYLKTSYQKYEVVGEESREVVAALSPTIHRAWQFTHDEDGAWYKITGFDLVFHRPSFLEYEEGERAWRVRTIATPMFKKGGEVVK